MASSPHSSRRKRRLRAALAVVAVLAAGLAAGLVFTLGDDDSADSVRANKPTTKVDETNGKTHDEWIADIREANPANSSQSDDELEAGAERLCELIELTDGDVGRWLDTLAETHGNPPPMSEGIPEDPEDWANQIQVNDITNEMGVSIRWKCPEYEASFEDYRATH